LGAPAWSPRKARSGGGGPEKSDPARLLRLVEKRQRGCQHPKKGMLVWKWWSGSGRRAGSPPEIAEGAGRGMKNGEPKGHGEMVREWRRT